MSVFVAKSFFNVMAANVVLDRLYFEIEKAHPALALNTVFCMTGRAAAELQGAAPQLCDQVVFLTSDAGLFDWIRDVLPKKIAHKGVLKFKGRTVFYFDSLVLEVWWDPGVINILLLSGVYVQHIDDINEILL